MLSSTFVSLSIFAAVAQAGKRGLCWPWYNKSLYDRFFRCLHNVTSYHSDPGVFNNGDGQVVAIYDYETYAPPSTNGDGGLGFIGMQRCLDCTSSPIADLYSRWRTQGWTTVFSLNEPDTSGISPKDAASWYMEHINPLAIKKALPAVTSSTTTGMGLSWLSEMISACAGRCYFDYINLHWYGNSFAEFQSYVESAHARFPDYQLVITEFALQNPSGGQAAQVSFFQEAFAFLDSASYVQLYFPFVATSPSLLREYGGSAVSYVGTDSCLYNDGGSPSAVGNLMY